MAGTENSQLAARRREVLQQLEGPLLRYALRLTGDAEAARDVVQDTLARWCQRRAAENRNHDAAWLFKVCRNRAIDLARRESRMTTLAAVELDARAAAGPPPESAVETNDVAAKALRLLATLPARQQEVVGLKFQAGLSYREIAEVTGLKATNVGFLIHTAIRTIRERMGVESVQCSGFRAPSVQRSGCRVPGGERG
jgi:RNA polymerase sigma-70 factor (ECF subfamily)